MDSTAPTPRAASTSSRSPLQCVLEICLHVRQFKNVDLFRQGFYHVRSTFYSAEVASDGRRINQIRARPYHCIDAKPPVQNTRPLPRSVSSTLNGTHLYAAFIEDDAQYHATTTFRVQYCEQVAELSDACVFRLETSARSSNGRQLFMEMELCFAEFSHDDFARGVDPPAPAQFERVSRVTCRIDNPTTGSVHSFVPVTFDDQHCCLLNCMVHTMLVEYRFNYTDERLQSVRPPTAAPITTNESKTNVESTSSSSMISLSDALSLDDVDISISRSDEQNIPTNPPANYPSTHTNSTHSYHPVALVLFPRLLNSNSPVNSSDPSVVATEPVPPYTIDEISSLVDRYHTFFIVHLIRAYNELAINFELTVQACVDSSHRSKFLSELAAVKPLELPAEWIEGHSTPTHSFSFLSVQTKSDPSNSDHAADGQTPITNSPQLPDTAGSKKSIVASASSHGLSSIASPSALANGNSANHGTIPSQSSRTQHSGPRRRNSHGPRYDEERAHAETVASLQLKYPMPRLLRLSDRLKDQLTYDIIARTILHDLNLVSAQCSHLWQVWVHSLSLFTPRIFSMSADRWHRMCTEHWAAFVFRESYLLDHRFKQADEELLSSHSQVAAVARKNAPLTLPRAPVLIVEHVNLVQSAQASATTNTPNDIAPVAIRRGGFMGDYENQVVLFEEAYTPPEADQSFTNSAVSHPRVDRCPDEQKHTAMSNIDVDHTPLVQTGPDSRPIPAALLEAEMQQKHVDPSAATRVSSRNLSQTSRKHVVVLCHGYQGNSWDLRLFRNQLAMAFPDLLLVSSIANENNTEDDIAVMGERLANEVVSVLSKQCKGQPARLSFIAHSLGGVIVRQSLTLPIMAPYLASLYTFISLGTPHLGYLYAENPLMSTGLWLLRKWNKSVCLSQLSLSDAPVIESTLIYKLAMSDRLHHFKNIFLLGSQMDKYVPFHSARIENCRDAINDKTRTRGAGYQRMVNAILKPINKSDHVFKRLNIQFVQRRTNIDSFIGRAAHIAFLDQQDYMQALAYIYAKYISG